MNIFEIFSSIMQSLPIVTGTKAPVLRTKAKKVKNPLSTEIQALIPKMFESMWAAQGIGLAAPQIGVSLRLCVLAFDDVRLVCINPALSALSKEKVLFEEGCLSLPGQYFMIERHEKVTVRYQDEKGISRKLKATGLLAIALQHEVDHLEGVLIVDRYQRQKTTVSASVKKIKRFHI